jgi:hypothetical protein
MAQRFKANDLKEMIRTIVKQEIRQVVVETINEVLSDRYLRRLAETVAVSRPRGVASLEQMGEPALEEDPPRALEQEDEWPYRKHPLKHDDEIDESSDPMVMFFEGTKPLDQVEKEKEALVEQKTNRALASPEGQNVMAIWKKIADRVDKKAHTQAEMRLSPEKQMKALEERRKKLEIKVG